MRTEHLFGRDIGSHDGSQVPVHGVLAEHELAGDVGVSQSLRDKFE